jgi:hypothetical protein
MKHRLTERAAHRIPRVLCGPGSVRLLEEQGVRFSVWIVVAFVVFCFAAAVVCGVWGSA